MKIAFDHQIFSSQKYGGISRYFVNLAEHLSDSSRFKSNVKVIAPFHKNDFLMNASKQLKVLQISSGNLARSKRITRIANDLVSSVALRSFQPDIIHETYYSCSVRGPIATRRVITVYDMIHELFPAYFSLSDKTSELKRISIGRADHVICISENTRNDLVRILGIDKEKISVIHLGFAFNLATPPPKAKVNDKPFILYVGARGGYKNFSTLILAYASSRRTSSEFDLVCFGGGPFGSDEILLFNKLGISEGAIKQVSGGDELLAAHYSNASIFVYPSLYEGFGIPPLEAMSFGCAVACSNTSSIPEVVGDSAALFDPQSVDSLSETLEKTLFHSDFKRYLIEKGLNRIQQFSWERCAEETLAVYQKVSQ